MSNKAIMEFGKMLTKVENISTTCAAVLSSPGPRPVIL